MDSDKALVSWRSRIKSHQPSLVNINVALIKEVMEDIDGLDCRLAKLLVAEDEVNPLMQMCRDVVTLQGHAVQADELPGVPLGPGRQHHIIQLLPALFTPCCRVQKG